jgi:hypothetical protein
MHRDAIVDLARGEAVPQVLAQAAEAHLAGCHLCQIEMRRQHALTAALRTLAADARGWTGPEELDDRVLAAVATGETAAVNSGRERTRITATGDGSRQGRVWARAGAWGLAAAAALALAVWSSGYRREEPPAPARSTTTPLSTPVAAAAEKTVVPAASQGAAQKTVRGRPAGARRAVPAANRPASPLQFIEIPGAAGLPAFESGAIVRLELPVAALPSYGVAIAPDARRLLVEADVLVGQDGQMRGIRLVSSEADASGSRSRQ